nr:hypothetical protein [Tanacetum cinerariifolium]
PNAPSSWWRWRCGDGDNVGGGGCGVVLVWRGDSGGGLWCRQRGDDGSHGGAAVVVMGMWCRQRRCGGARGGE